MSSDSSRVIKGYELREMLGQGGFGAVYRAFQPVVEREVAVKVILPEYANQPEFIRSFETEAQTIARLEHPFIIPLFDYWREPDSAYLVMRFLRGGSLSSRLKLGKLPLDEVLRLFDQITAALTFAHRQGVVHRDLKPDNILLDEEGNAYISDFGIARHIGKDPTSQIVSGSLRYMSPDQLRNDTPAPQADIYSLGIVLYEVLTGKYPYEDIPTWQLVNIHMTENLPDIRELSPDLSFDVNEVLQKATAKNAEERYSDARQMMADLRRALLPETAELVEEIEVFGEVVNPYKGLRAFQEADAADFYGRENLVAQLLSRLTENHPYNRFLAVVGPSGSGKSSVVRAGLVPALRIGALPHSDNWFVVDMVPGAQPLRQLEAALLSVAQRPPSRLYEMLRADIGGLTWAVDRVLADVDGDLVLIIDQFEEIFTMLDDEAERIHFLELIKAAVTMPDSRVRVVITLRADFTDRPLEYASFGELMRARTEFVLPLSADEIERAIRGPAVRVGLQVDPDLTAAIIADVSEEPGALPLLQYALTEVFDRRDNRHLTLEGYQASGGVLGALARRAEEVFVSLDAQQQVIARQILLRMVTLGEGTEDTRRRASRTELAEVANDPHLLQSVLDAFGRPRLLSFDVDPGTRVPMVEVAHEALIREWSRLHGWLDNSRADVRLQRVLASEAGEWEKSGKDPSFLMSGARLAQYEEWQQTTDLALTQSEKNYLQASIEERARRDAAEAERRRREEEIAERAATYATRAKQLRRAAVVLGVVIVLALIASAFLGAQVVNTQQEVQQGQTQIAGVQPTLAEANTQIAGVEPTLDAANAQIASANTQVAGVVPTLDAANRQINSASTQIADANAQATVAQEQVVNAQGQIATATVQISTAQAQITAANAQVAAGETQVAGFVPTIDYANTQVAGVEPTLNAADAQIVAANTQVAAGETQVAIANQEIAAANTQVAGVQPTLNAADAQIAAANTQVGFANTQVAGVEPTIAAANTQVAEGQAQVAAFEPTVIAANTQAAGVVPTLAAADTQVAAAGTQVAAANTQIAAANTQVAGVAPTVDAANAQIAAANTQVGFANTQVAGVQPTVAFANTQAAAVVPTLAAADAQIASANTQIAAAGTRVAGVEPTLNAADAQIAVANTQVAAGETQVAGVEPTVEFANTQVAAVQPTLNAADERIGAANTQVAAGETRVAAFEPTVQSAETQVAAVGPTLAAADAQIAFANTQVAGGETQVAAANQQIAAANTEIAGVAPTLNAANAQIAAANTRIAGVEPTLDTANTQIAGVAPTLDSANTQIAGVVPTLDAVQAEVESQRQIADALRLVRSADQLLQAGNPDLAIALVLQAFQLNPNLGEVQRILNDAIPLTVRLSVNSSGLVEFTPDGRWLAVSNSDGVDVYDLATRGRLRTLLTSRPTAMVISPDGLQIVIGTSGGNIHVYDITTGLERFTFSQHNNRITDLDYHPTERQLVSGDASGVAYVWNLERGEIINQLPEPHNFPIVKVTYNENGSAAYSYDLINRSDLQRRRPRIGVFNFGQSGAFRNPPEYRGFSPNGRIAYTGADGTDFLKFYDADSTVEQRIFRLGNSSTDYIDPIAFSDDGRYILVEVETRNYTPDRSSYVVQNRYIALWEIATGGEIRRFNVPVDDPNAWDIYSLAFSSDGRLALSGGRYSSIYTVTLWDVATGQEIRRFTGHPSPPTQVAFGGDGSYAVSASDDGNVRVWDIGAIELNITGRVHVSANSLDAFGISADGTKAYVAVNNQALTTYDLTAQQEVRNVNIFTGARLDIAFNPTQPQALVVAVDRMALYDTVTLERLYVFEDVTPQAVSAVAFSPDGRFLFYAIGATTYRWEIESRSIFQTIRRGGTHIASNNNNEFIALADDRTIHVIDMVTGEDIQTFNHSGGRINSLDFSPHDDTVLTAVGEPDNSVIVWDIRTGAPRYTLIGHTASVTTALYSPDGLSALSGADDTTLILWDLTSGQAIRQYQGHTAPVKEIWFNPQGFSAHSISTVLADGIIAWRVESARDTVNWTYANRYIREINCQERLQYGVQPYCEGDVIPTPLPTPTSQATATPTPTNTPRPTPTPTFTPIPTGVITTDGSLVNVRSGAGAGFSLVTQVQPGVTVEILEVQAEIGWVRIRLPDGTIGWVQQGVVR